MKESHSQNGTPTGAIAVIPAAGSSSRIKSALSTDSKALHRFSNGYRVIELNLKMLHLAGIRNIIIPTREELIGTFQLLADSTGPWNTFHVLPGGDSRFASIRTTLDLLSTYPNVDDLIVLVHDAARPFVSPGHVTDLCSACLKSGAGIVPGLMPASTIKIVSGDSNVVETLPRDFLVEVQTPQVFPLRKFIQAYSEAEETALRPFFDDASVFESMSYPVKILKGESTNIKITTPFDLDLGELILSRLKLGLKLKETKNETKN